MSNKQTILRDHMGIRILLITNILRVYYQLSREDIMSNKRPHGHTSSTYYEYCEKRFTSDLNDQYEKMKFVPSAPPLTSLCYVLFITSKSKTIKVITCLLVLINGKEKNNISTKSRKYNSKK